MKILLDMDSVISNFFYGVLNAYHKEMADVSPKLDPFVGPDFVDDWDKEFPNGKTIHDYYQTPGFFLNLKPIDGAHDVMKGLYDEGHDIVIVSSAQLTTAPGEKYQWLSKHYPWIHRKNVIFASRKEMVLGDVLIDDSPRNAIDYRAAHPNSLIIGIRYPYHKEPEHIAPYDLLATGHRDLAGAWEKIGRYFKNYHMMF